MTVGATHVIVLATALFACGFFLVLRRAVDLAAGLAVALTSTAVALAGISRFAASGRDPLSGQEFAIVVLFCAVPLALLAQRLRIREGA
jgi:NADH:ubiquinone oxidoreductase subunit K